MQRKFIMLAMLSGLLAGCATQQAPVETPEEAPVEAPAKAPAEVPAEVPADNVKINKERKTVMILMKTSKGDIKLELDKEKAPKTVANFLSYVESGHYTGTIFHRVIDGFMIQGGGFDENMRQKAAPNTVENEAANGLKNVVGSVAMARTADPHSAGAQFFINVKDNTFLDYPGQDGWGYCVFGQVVEGMDVVNAIKGVPTGGQDVPNDPITISEVVVVD
jgi:cyclophilin family peptidyl-prolyl cis-trans isomerase